MTDPRSNLPAQSTSFIGRERELAEVERLRGELLAAVQHGQMHEFVPFSGQTAGAIHDILPAAEIVRRLATEAEEALARAGKPRSPS